VFVLALAFAISWLGLYFQDRFLPPSRSAPAGIALDAPETAYPEPTWEQDGLRVVAREIAPGGLPLPAGARALHEFDKTGAWGKGFQGFYECALSPAQLVRFYEQALPAVGWRIDRVFSEAMTAQAPGASLAFERQGVRVDVNVFPADKGREGAEFRLSALARSPAVRR